MMTMVDASLARLRSLSRVRRPSVARYDRLMARVGSNRSAKDTRLSRATSPSKPPARSPAWTRAFARSSRPRVETNATRARARRREMRWNVPIESKYRGGTRAGRDARTTARTTMRRARADAYTL